MTGPSQAPAQRGIEIQNLFSAIPDLALAGTYLLTWLAPTTLGDRVIGSLMLVMLLEFINVHSAAIMGNALVAPGAPRGKVVAVVGLGSFYTLFVGAFALAFQRWWPLVAFWGLTLNRLTPVLFGQAPRGKEKQFVQRSWAVGAMLYLAGVFPTTIAPVPRFGITEEVVRAQDLPGSGLWIDEPWRVIAFGFLYFTGWGISELYAHRWLPEERATEPGTSQRRP
jgi:hypothetical protein